MISQLLKKYLKEKYIIKILVITSVFFLLFRISNLLFGQSLYDTINQCLFTLGFGLLMGAIFIRTGNSIPCIIAHIINNILAFSDIGFKDNNLLLNVFPIGQIIYYIFFILMILIAFYLVRKDKQEDIILLWKEKWTETV